MSGKGPNPAKIDKWEIYILQSDLMHAPPKFRKSTWQVFSLSHVGKQSKIDGQWVVDMQCKVGRGQVLLSLPPIPSIEIKSSRQKDWFTIANEIYSGLVDLPATLFNPLWWEGVSSLELCRR